MAETRRNEGVYSIHDLNRVKRQLLAWADTYPVAVYLDSNEYPLQRHTSWECLVAVGAAGLIEAPAGDAFATLNYFYEKNRDWLFGFLGYDLKNEVENLRSEHPDRIDLPDLFFFQPEIVAGIRSRKYASGDSPATKKV